MNKKEVRIAFMGTASFSSFVLKGLLDNGYNVVAVVSQPDKEIGRKRILEETEVKKLAKEYNIPVYQPIKLRKEFDFFNDIKPDLVISAAYGQIVPDEVLVMPKYGCINVHGSLLPAYRGGAPIQRAIINGDSKTGITIMEMAHDMDAGLMYSKAEVEISDDDNYETLINKLMVVGRDLLLATLPDYLDGKIKGEVQDPNLVTFARNIKREDELIDWNKSAADIHNLIRGISPTPGAYTTLDGKELKIYKSKLILNEDTNSAENGTIIKADKTGIVVKCGHGYIFLEEIQLEGKKKMFYKDFLNGLKEPLVGRKLG